MDVDDRGLAALADRLHGEDPTGGARPLCGCIDQAAELLGKRGVFLEDGVDILEGHRICEENSDAEIARLNSEIVRLRKIEAAAGNPRLWYALIAVEEQGMKPEIDALRAALEATP